MQDRGKLFGVGWFLLSSLCLCVSVVHSSSAAEPWATYRGNVQRTGCTDGKAGPASGKVLWVYRSRDHFLCAPVPDGSRLYLSGLGFVNTSSFYALNADPDAAERVAWSKGPSFLKQSTVSSPALAGGKVVFGTGMHQDNGAILFALSADGAPVWQYPVPGELVHMEGSPTSVDGRVYLGAGSAGVLCVELDRLTLDGKEMSAAAVVKALKEKRAELQTKYEEAKKKGDKFAMPPTDDDLPKPAPVKVWQVGQGKWHVDAPVSVVGDRVLVASAFLDKEMAGRRALFCLDAKSGKELWSAPLSINPWGGPSVQGDTVVVSGSSVSMDPKLLKGAKGVVAAFDLSTGKQKWSKNVPGGVLGCAALTKDSAVVSATDGKVRSFNLATGGLRWFYDGKAPFFAPVAVAGDTVYAGDIKGVVHAVNVKTGGQRWALDLGTSKDVAAPGMIYGGPVVQGGRLFVATCNLAGDHANKPTAVVCIGDK